VSKTLFEKLVAASRQAVIAHPKLRAVTLAQWMLESGRGTSKLATLHNNFGGLKWRPEMAAYATKVFYEAHDGGDYYCRFAGPEAFIRGYWAFLERAPYRGWKSHTATPEAFIRFIGPIYTPSANYADKVLALLDEAGDLLAAQAAPTPAPVTPDIDLGVIVLDPGHGGAANVSGSSWNNATSASGVKEKALTLLWCQTLKDQILSQAAAAGEKIKVVLTRTTDVNLTGAARAKKTRETGAKAFVCLHFNGLGDKTVSGTETFYRAPQNGNVNLAADIAFGQALHDAMLAGLRQVRPETRDRKLKPDTATGPGALGVLNDAALGNHQPGGRLAVSTYFEVEFITNPAVDAAFISGPNADANRTTVMASVARAVRARMRLLP
jgi:N-acetylmuramoyl-L-alanine amidase